MHPLFHPLFIKYCTYFNGNQDYFECHEVLEEYWKELNGKKNHPLVGYIQIASSLYHWRRNNIKGAYKLMKNAMTIMESNSSSIFFEHIDFPMLSFNCQNSFSLIQSQLPFRSFFIHITNDTLRQLVQEEIGNLPKMDEHFLLHKHMLRNRTDILQLREQNRKRFN